jgi:biofilm PGA synthesis N-glycosyltransferase PgaC
MPALLFWISACCVLLSYLGYPLLLAVWSRLRHRPVVKAACYPPVSVVLPVYNGERFLGRKLANLLALDYPPEFLEIIVVSDGSTDRTVDIVRSVSNPRIKLVEFPARRGKPAALNAGVAQATSQVLVFNDVRQTLAPDAIQKLVANLNDPAVGAATGQFVLASEGGPKSAQLGFYARYEQWIRKKESRIHSMIGAAGAFSAIRRELYRPLPAEVLLDDVYIPMQIIFQGYRNVFETEAVAYDPLDHRPEFYRKLRTLTGNYQILRLLPAILSWRNPVLAQYLGHKVSRLLVPFFLLIAFGTSLYLHSGFYAAALVAQVWFYGVAIAFRQLDRVPGIGKLAAAGYSFVVANCAAFLGFFMFLRGKRDLWV